jgi:hypothetical protein
MYDGTNDIIAPSEILGRSDSSRSHFDPELVKIPELLKKSPSETMTKYEPFRSPISQRVSKPPSAYERVRQWVCGLGGWPPQRAEGFTRKCVGAVRLPSRSSFGPLWSGSCGIISEIRKS